MRTDQIIKVLSAVRFWKRSIPKVAHRKVTYKDGMSSRLVPELGAC